MTFTLICLLRNVVKIKDAYIFAYGMFNIFPYTTLSIRHTKIEKQSSRISENQKGFTIKTNYSVITLLKGVVQVIFFSLALSY